MDNDIRDEGVLSEFLRRAKIEPRIAEPTGYTVFRVHVRDQWVDFWFTKEGDYTEPPTWKVPG